MKNSGTGTQHFRSLHIPAAPALDQGPPPLVMKSHHMRRKGELSTVCKLIYMKRQTEQFKRSQLVTKSLGHYFATSILPYPLTPPTPVVKAYQWAFLALL